MNEALQRLGVVSREYETKANGATDVYVAAARAESAYKRERAKASLRFKESGGRMSVAEAELRADADDAVASLYEDRLVLAATAAAHKDKLIQLREQNANGRTAVVDERAGDEIHARGHGGAA